MGVRCLELVNEFEIKVIDKRFFYNTTNLQPSDLNEIFLNISENPSFKYWFILQLPWKLVLQEMKNDNT